MPLLLLRRCPKYSQRELAFHVLKPNRCILQAVILLALCGCHTSQPTLSTVNGEVKQPNGDPYGVVKVTFYPENGPNVETLTDVEGYFTAQVPLGKSTVSVIAVESAEPLPDGVFKRNIKPKYHSGETSGFAVEIIGRRVDKLVFVPE